MNTGAIISSNTMSTMTNNGPTNVAFIAARGFAPMLVSLPICATKCFPCASTVIVVPDGEPKKDAVYVFSFSCTILCNRASVLLKQFLGKGYTGWFCDCLRISSSGRNLEFVDGAGDRSLVFTKDAVESVMLTT